MNNAQNIIELFGHQMPKLGIGTWGIGGYMTKSPYSDYVNEITQLKYQLNKGLVLIDCWIAQGEGSSVDLIRQAIEEFNRDKYVLLCKFDIHKYESADQLDVYLNKYLRQLNVDYIDVFQIHKPDFSKISEKEIEKFLKENMASGKIRHFALSNASKSDIQNIIKKIDVKLEAVEILYNLFERGAEKDGTTEFCKDNGITVIAYRPLNRGMVNVVHTSEVISAILSKYSITVSQLALNWLLSKPNTIALVKSANRSHINENLDCLSVKIAAEDLEKLDNWNY